MISIDVKNLSKLAGIAEKLSGIRDKIIDVIVDELWEYAKVLHEDRSIPEDYRNALAVTVIPEFDSAVLFVDLDLPADNNIKNRFLYERFGDRASYAMYTCPKRKYFGGKLVKEYNGPSYIKQKWEIYKNVFITKVKSRIVDILKGDK